MAEPRTWEEVKELMVPFQYQHLSASDRLSIYQVNGALRQGFPEEWIDRLCQQLDIVVGFAIYLKQNATRDSAAEQSEAESIQGRNPKVHRCRAEADKAAATAAGKVLNLDNPTFGRAMRVAGIQADQMDTFIRMLNHPNPDRYEPPDLCGIVRDNILRAFRFTGIRATRSDSGLFLAAAEMVIRKARLEFSARSLVR